MSSTAEPMSAPDGEPKAAGPFGLAAMSDLWRINLQWTQMAMRPMFEAPLQAAALWAAAADQSRYWMDASRALADVCAHGLRRSEEAVTGEGQGDETGAVASGGALTAGIGGSVSGPLARPWQPRPSPFMDAAAAWRDAGASLFEAQWRAYTSELASVARDAAAQR